MNNKQQLGRQPAASDFQVPVEGIGTFTFGRRTMRDEMRIAAEYSRITEGLEQPSPQLHQLATYISTVKIMTVQAPDGWDIDAMDPLDDETYTNLERAFVGLRLKENSFRPKPAPGGENGGEAAR